MKRNGRLKKNLALKPLSEVTRLVRAFEGGQGGGLFFGVYDSHQSRQRAVKELRKALGTVLLGLTWAELVRSLDMGEVTERRLVWIEDFEKASEKRRVEHDGDLLDVLEARHGDVVVAAQPILILLSLEEWDHIRDHLPTLFRDRAGLFGLELLPEHRYRTSYFLKDFFAGPEGAFSLQQKRQLVNLYLDLLTEYQSWEIEIHILYQYDLLGRLSRQLFRLGELDRAEKYLKQQRELAGLIGEERLRPEILNNLSRVYAVRGDFQQAIALLEEAWEIAEERFRGENHPGKAILLANMADVLCGLGEMEQAYLKCRRAMRILEYKKGLRHPDLVPVLDTMGRIYLFQGKSEDALDAYRRSLQIIERRLELNHPYVGIMMQNIGTVYFEQGRFGIARRYLYRTLEPIEQTYGAEHPYLATVLSRIGELHFRRGEFGKADMYLRWAIDIRNRRVGAGDLAIAYYSWRLAAVLDAQGHGEEAGECRRSALAVFRIKLPEYHSDINALEAELNQPAPEPVSVSPLI